MCFFWGTTYLGIRIALESLSPLALVSLRFTISGGLLLAAMLAGGARLPRGRHLWVAAGAGILSLGVANCCLCFAELWIPSGLAALIVTVSPFWMVGIESLMPGGERLHPPALLGMVIGLSGSALLVAPGVSGAANSGLLRGFLLLQLGCACWSFGSIYQRRHSGPVHPLMASAVQQLAAGLAALPLAAGSASHLRWNWHGAAAVAYLVVFGSIVGHSAYLYALDRLPVAVVSIYSYVNPAVAVTLGWLFYREPFGLRQAGAMVVIFSGVALVKLSSPQGRGSLLAEHARAQSPAEGGHQRESHKSRDQRQQKLYRAAQDLQKSLDHLR